MVVLAARRERDFATVWKQVAVEQDRVAKAHDRVLSMSEPRFVLEHLRQQGVAPYLATDTVEKRVLQDIATVMRLLHCDRDTAVRYINRGVLGPEPAASTSHGGPAGDGGGEGTEQPWRDPLRQPG